jgi:hypothetical protein
MSMPAGLAIGTGLSLLITLAGACVTAWLLSSEYIAVEQIGYGSLVTLITASAAGAWIASMLIKHRHLMVCVTTGGLYYASLIMITAVFFGGQYQGMGVTLLAILAGCGSVAIMKTRPRRTITKGYKKLQTS